MDQTSDNKVSKYEKIINDSQQFISNHRAFIVTGCQWGDEAKGKFICELMNMLLQSPVYNNIFCIRSNGGANAGHSVWRDNVLFDTHNLPTGVVSKIANQDGSISNEKVKNIIGNGVLVNIVSLFDEIEKLTSKGLRPTANLYIAQECHCTFLIQSLYDCIANMKLGTTKKGIAPTASDKLLRRGIRMDDIIDNTWKSKLINLYNIYSHTIGIELLNLLYPEYDQHGNRFTEEGIDIYWKELCGVEEIRINKNITSSIPIDYYKLRELGLKNGRNNLITKFIEIGIPIKYNPSGVGSVVFTTFRDMLDFEIKFIEDRIDTLVPLITDVSEMLYSYGNNTDSVFLFEGANSVMLDPSKGVSPCVTSTTCTISHVIEGTGLNIDWFVELRYIVIGVAKGYITRVGTGSLPTKASNESALMLRTIGNERGVTTGRDRECGYEDIPQLAHALKISGAKFINLTKLDVLSQLEKIPVCIEYLDENCKNMTSYPSNEFRLSKVTPQYVYLDGWKNFDISKCDSYEKLHENIKNFILFLENELTKKIGKKISVLFINTGKEESQLIFNPTIYTK